MWISRRKKGVMNLNVESTGNWGASYSAFRMAMHPAKKPSRSLRGRGPVPTRVSFGTPGVFEANEWSRFQILTARTQSLTVRNEMVSLAPPSSRLCAWRGTHHCVEPSYEWEIGGVSRQGFEGCHEMTWHDRVLEQTRRDILVATGPTGGVARPTGEGKLCQL